MIFILLANFITDSFQINLNAKKIVSGPGQGKEMDTDGGKS